MNTGRGTVVGRLLVRGRAAGAARVALERATLAPPDLGPAAVLVVRRMADPLPGALAVDATLRWQAAAEEALAEVARGAARPLAGPVPAAATAVLFADRAELLAALAADWVRGELAARWWWRTLRPPLGGDEAATVAARWVSQVRYAPAALGLLAAGGRDPVRAFAGKLAGRAATVAAAIATAWGAPVDVAGAVARNADRASDTHAGPSVTSAPWSRWAPEAEEAPTPAACLLGVGLTVARAPAVACQPAFWTALREWLSRRPPVDVAAEATVPVSRYRASAVVPDQRDPAPVAPTPARADSGPQRPVDAGAHDDAQGNRTPGAPERRDRESAPPHHPADRPTAPAMPAVRSAARTAVAATGVADAPQTASTIGTGRTGRTRPVPSDHDEPFRPEPNVPSVRPGSAGPVMPGRQGTTVPTGLGGLFFLLNMALRLELYGDFTSPARPGIALSPWDFLTLLGRELLESAAPAGADAHHGDPIWRLLAGLAGRGDDQPPGEGFVPPGIATRRRRPLRLWVVRLATEIRAQLAAAVQSPPDEAVQLVLCIPARVLVTPGHVDVTMSLADLPIQVRLSGLDRDPGWIPAAGRSVAFYFE